MKDQSCKTPRWRILKAQLNNLEPLAFEKALKEAGENALLIDVRTPGEFQSGWISGAKNISYLSDDFWDRIEKLPPDKYCFVYCRSGRRSIRACTLMKNGGFDNLKIFNLEGGIIRWLEEKKTLEV